jgi:hypothetical protein
MRSELARRLNRIERAIAPREPLVIEVHYVDRTIRRDEPGAPHSATAGPAEGYRVTLHADGRITREDL